MQIDAENCACNRLGEQGVPDYLALGLISAAAPPRPKAANANDELLTSKRGVRRTAGMQKRVHHAVLRRLQGRRHLRAALYDNASQASCNWAEYVCPRARRAGSESLEARLYQARTQAGAAQTTA